MSKYDYIDYSKFIEPFEDEFDDDKDLGCCGKCGSPEYYSFLEEHYGLCDSCFSVYSQKSLENK